jgi:dienelactone hydrolase
MMASRMAGLRFSALAAAMVLLALAARGQSLPPVQAPPASQSGQVLVPSPPTPAPDGLWMDLSETIAKVPVTVRLADGRFHTGEMVVTHVRPRGAGPFPLVVQLHGRSADRAERRRFRSIGSVRYWTRRGFAVVVPTRLGYGDSGLSPDPEFSSRACADRTYAPAMAAMMAQFDAVLAFAHTLPWIDASRVIVVGQSYGAFAAIGASGRAVPGLRGAISFAGGGGGNPRTRPANPCGPDKLGEVIAAAGKTAKVPMLWLYAENDKYWGAKLPRMWHAAYAAAGGKAELVMFPPVGEDGHKLLGEGFSTWRPHADRFLEGLGFAPPRSQGSPPATQFAPLQAIDMVPYLKATGRSDGYAKFLAGDLPRAFAIAPGGAWGAVWGSEQDAPERAIERCQKHGRAGCRLYAVDDSVVWTSEIGSETAGAAR